MTASEERKRFTDRRWRKTHPEARKLAYKTYYQRHKAEIELRRKQYQAANVEHVCAQRRRQRQTNLEKILASDKRYKARDEVKLREKRRKALIRLRDAPAQEAAALQRKLDAAAKQEAKTEAKSLWGRKYYAAHRDVLIFRMKLWQAFHREELRYAKRRYREKITKQVFDTARVWIASHPQAMAESPI